MNVCTGYIEPVLRSCTQQAMLLGRQMGNIGSLEVDPFGGEFGPLGVVHGTVAHHA